jgi:hypothetical protein
MQLLQTLYDSVFGSAHVEWGQDWDLQWKNQIMKIPRCESLWYRYRADLPSDIWRWNQPWRLWRKEFRGGQVTYTQCIPPSYPPPRPRGVGGAFPSSSENR